jgi:hypothetical protein
MIYIVQRQHDVENGGVSTDRVFADEIKAEGYTDDKNATDRNFVYYIEAFEVW